MSAEAAEEHRCRDVAVDKSRDVAVDKSRDVAVDGRALGPPDLALVELLARLALTARRAGGRLRIQRPPRELVELLQAVGLAEALGALPVVGRETVRQPEHREPPLGVEERVHLDDPTV